MTLNENDPVLLREQRLKEEADSDANFQAEVAEKIRKSTKKLNDSRIAFNEELQKRRNMTWKK